MKGYKTSKDYKRLKELLDEGYEVVIVEYGIKGPILSHGHTVFERRKYYLCGSCIWGQSDPDSFEETCRLYGIEFIEPTEIIDND